jgi:hypothetical protein
MSNDANIITIKSALGKDRKLIVQPSKDEKTRWYKGVPRLSDEDKKGMKFWTDKDSKLVITNNFTFNLNEDIEKLNWAWVQHSPEIAKNFEACQIGKATWYVDNHEEELTKALSIEEKLIKALNLVMNDRDDLLSGRVRVLGFEMSGDNPKEIKKFLYKMAKSPDTIDKVINSYESNTLGIQLLFFRAMDKGIIKEKNGAVMYGNEVLGVGDDAALTYMKDKANEAVVEQIKSELGDKSTEDMIKVPKITGKK